MKNLLEQLHQIVPSFHFTCVKSVYIRKRMLKSDSLIALIDYHYFLLLSFHKKGPGGYLIRVDLIRFPGSMDHSPIRQTFKFENNFSTVGKSFLNLVKL